jgi:hypothetical protein
VIGGRTTSVAGVIDVIERKGASEIVDAIPETTRRELATALAQRERFDSDAAAVLRGGRVPTLDEINAPALAGHQFDSLPGFELVSEQMGRVFAGLREHPPTTDAQRERVRGWALGLLDFVDKLAATR